uniref:Sedlin n=1 Tax=Trypanosoma congolense (strain IL3000) TaxID=1068625 RepID=G0UTH0_TRYCI|nr:conserved hypothetical protein [Trypanosoma congolense IL3000]
MAHSWAVAAIALFSHDGKPLIVRTFTSPSSGSGNQITPKNGGVYVSEEDVMRLHVLIMSSLDRCEEIVLERRSQHQNSPEKSCEGASSPRSTARVSAGADARFLGKLIRSYMFTTYGFQSASGIRTILAVVGDAPLDAVLPLCRTTYEAASAALCNPFCIPRASAQFLQRLYRVPGVDLSPCKAEPGARLPMPTREAMDEDPSLSNSRAFNAHIRTNIEPFTSSSYC